MGSNPARTKAPFFIYFLMCLRTCVGVGFLKMMPSCAARSERSTTCNGFKILTCFRYQEKLRVHALRVMAVVEKLLNRIDCEENAAKVRSLHYFLQTYQFLISQLCFTLLKKCQRCTDQLITGQCHPKNWPSCTH